MSFRPYAIAFVVLLLLVLSSFRAHPQIDLHAHLFMKQGMTFLFTGGFHDPIQARTWEDGRRSQANPDTVNASGLRLIVVSLYANPALAFDMKDALRDQIRLFQDWIQSEPDWIHARSSDEARQALYAQKRVAVLSLEGAAGFFETDQDYREWIETAGIRIVTLLHLMDDDYGGVALLPGLNALASPFGLLSSVLRGSRDADTQVRTNPRGLHAPGLKLAKRLMSDGIWIDLSHASDHAQRALIELHANTKKPLLYTHTVLRETLRAERGLSTKQIQALNTLGGMVGLMPAHDYLKNTPVSEDIRSCNRDIARLRWQWQTLQARLGPARIALGTDTNGAIPHLDTCTPGGYRHIGQLPELWHELDLNVPHTETIETFLTLWSRAEQKSAHANRPLQPPEP